jgi:formylglycine-generating enzyme
VSAPLFNKTLRIGVLLLGACEAETPARDVQEQPAVHAGPELVSVATVASTLEVACRSALLKANCAEGWCTVPAGCFWQGSPEDEFGHAPLAERRTAVHLTHAFRIQAHEVTRSAWLKLGLRDPMKRDSNACRAADCPVDNVTWFEAAAYANALSRREQLPACYELAECDGQLGAGLSCKRASSTTPSIYDCRGYRLPSDSEWEYAARAGTDTAFFTGPVRALSTFGACEADPALERAGWYCHNAGGRAHPVGTRAPNALGLYDTAGNVAEWVNDWTTGRAPSVDADPGAALDIAGAEHAGRTYRGGNYRAWSTLCRASFQGTGSWNRHAPGVGFRLARTL